MLGGSRSRRGGEEGAHRGERRAGRARGAARRSVAPALASLERTRAPRGRGADARDRAGGARPSTVRHPGRQPMLKRIHTPVLEVGFEETGTPEGTPVVLLHGVPYDVRAYDAVAAALAARCRVLVPYLRGYGPTRFLSAETMRSGQQAALGADLRGLLDALGIDRAVVGGYDWGGRAACIVSALWPERVRGLVSANGYNIQAIARAGEPHDPEAEHRHWYHYYVHSDRGRRGLDRNRKALCRLLWRLWSPTWKFSAEEY